MAVMVLLTFNGCSRGPAGTEVFSPPPNDAGTVPVGSASRQRSTNDAPASGRYVAVSHNFALRAASAEIETLQQKHMAECTRLGCSILFMSINRPDRGPIDGSMSVRIKPDAYDAFAAALAGPPAKIIRHSQAAEDLSVPVIDGEKRLAAKTALRDQLTALLNDDQAKSVADLITIEKELSATQGEIEAMSASLETLRRRTDTVRVDITYTSSTISDGNLDFAPVREAITGIGQTVVRSITWLIYCLAAVGPWLPVAALVWWIVRSIKRRRGRGAT
jgi:hypothetical protein